YTAAALVGIFLLLQAAVASWGRAVLLMFSLPLSVGGGGPAAPRARGWRVPAACVGRGPWEHRLAGRPAHRARARDPRQRPARLPDPGTRASGHGRPGGGARGGQGTHGPGSPVGTDHRGR